MSEGKNRKIEVTLHLAQPIACIIEKQDDLLFCEDAHLGIIAYGDTREEVMREFSNEFPALWNIIAEEKDSLLTKDARLLKRKLIELVRKVEMYGDTQGPGDQRRADKGRRKKSSGHRRPYDKASNRLSTPHR